MATLVHAVDRGDVPPLEMSDRFRHEITYFMALPGEPSVPKLSKNEYFVRLADARRWLDDGAFSIVSPLDSQNRTEIELSEEHELWLQWLVTHSVEHLRLATK